MMNFRRTWCFQQALSRPGIAKPLAVLPGENTRQGVKREPETFQLSNQKPSNQQPFQL